MDKVRWSDGRLYNPSRLRAKTKIREVMIRDMLFADDAGIVTHTVEDFQLLMDRLSEVCEEFGLIISLPKTKILPQDSSEKPSIRIDNELCVVEDFPYLGSNISESLSSFSKSCLGRPLFLFLCGFQSKACRGVFPGSFHSVWPSHHHCISLIWTSIGSCFAFSQRLVFLTLSNHLIFRI